MIGPFHRLRRIADLSEIEGVLTSNPNYGPNTRIFLKGGRGIIKLPTIAFDKDYFNYGWLQKLADLNALDHIAFFDETAQPAGSRYHPDERLGRSIRPNPKGFSFGGAVAAAAGLNFGAAPFLYSYGIDSEICGKIERVRAIFPGLTAKKKHRAIGCWNS